MNTVNKKIEIKCLNGDKFFGLLKEDFSDKNLSSLMFKEHGPTFYVIRHVARNFTNKVGYFGISKALKEGTTGPEFGFIGNLFTDPNKVYYKILIENSRPIDGIYTPYNRS